MSFTRPLIQYSRRKVSLKAESSRSERKVDTRSLDNDTRAPSPSRKRKRVAVESESESTDAQQGSSNRKSRSISKRKPIVPLPLSGSNGYIAGLGVHFSPPTTPTKSDSSPIPPPPPVTPKKPTTTYLSRSKSFDRLLAQELDNAEPPSTPKAGRTKSMKKRVTSASEMDDSPVKDSGRSISPSPSPSPIRSTASSPLKPSATLSAFDFLEITSKSANTSPARRGVTKRMLTKSKTEPIIPPPSIPLIQQAKLSVSQSLPLVDRERERPLVLPTIPDEPEASTSNSPQRPAAVTHRKTYAASRSFLVPLKLSDNGNGAVKHESQEDDLEEELRRESYIELQSRWGVDASNELEDSLLKSITEMRSKGENRRFLDEMGYLAEGLEEGNSLATQQGSAIEIIGKMCDMDFMRRAKAADFVQKTWEMTMSARGEANAVLDPALAFFAALIARDPHMLQELTNSDATALPFLLQAAETSEGDDKLVDPTSSRVSKSDRRSLEQILRIIKRSEIVEQPSKITTALLATRALRVLRFPPQEQDLVVQRISASFVVALLQSNPHVEEDMDVLEDGFDAYLGNLEFLHNCVSILEAFPIVRGSAFDQVLVDHSDDERKEQIALGLLYMACGDIILREDGEDRDLYSTSTVLRALVNVANDNASLCNALSSSSAPLQVILQLLQWSYREYLPISEEDKNLQDDAESRSKALDRFCLALGLLTNVIRGEEQSKDTLRDLTMSVSCTPRRECIRKATCSTTIGPIPFLVSLYSNHLSKAKEEPTLEDTFLTGHLAVLLGMLADANPANQRILLKALPGSSKADKLDDLIRTVEDFAASYEAVVAQLSRLEGSGAGAFQGREGAHAVEVEQNVAHDVARSLKALRDASRR